MPLKWKICFLQSMDILFSFVHFSYPAAGLTYLLFVLLSCCVALQRVSICTWCCTITELKDGPSRREFKFKPGENRFSQRAMKKTHQDGMGKHNKQQSQHIQPKPLSSFSQGKRVLRRDLKRDN